MMRTARQAGADRAKPAPPLRQETRFDLPGFTLPLNFNPKKGTQSDDEKPFRTALDAEDIEGGYVGNRLITLREITMMQMMDAITDKPEWDRSVVTIPPVFDDETTTKWRKEFLESGRDITQSMVTWVIEELKYKANIFQETGAVSVFDGDVVKSDTAVPERLKKALQEAIRVLEDVPQDQRDYHPGSDNTVLDLVHPSLFPLVYGRSRILRDEVIGLDDCLARSGGGEVIPVPPEEQTALDKDDDRYYGWRQHTRVPAFSRKFQWLPCDVKFGDNPDECYIASYINNLHPVRHRGLYDIIQQIIARAIPLWNMTLTPLKPGFGPRNRIQYWEVEYDNDDGSRPKPEGWKEWRNEDWQAFEERLEEWREKRLKLPEPGEFRPPPSVGTRRSPQPVNLREEFRDRGLQVIVKLANIELTPEKPEYAGGTWHIEGQMNEHICATAIYYYSNENITTSTLSFRQRADTDIAWDIRYEQNDHGWLPAVFGCDRDGPATQELGSVSCLENRLLTFPNILQHRVSPFALADRSRPGHRKILALFLVDPHIRVISTAHVPPQRRDWWDEQIDLRREPLGKLPPELQDMVIGQLDEFPITMDDAKQLRLELMEERSALQETQEGNFESGSFSLCEH